MDELGHILREARENKGLSLANIQEETRINVRFLEALEKGEFGALPSLTHARGFLNNYARFLGLNPQPLIDRFERSQLDMPVADPNALSAQTEATADLRTRRDQPFFDPVNLEVDAQVRRNPESMLRLVIILALLVSLGLVARRFVPLLLGNEEGAAALTEELTTAIQDIIEPEATAGTGDTATTLGAGEVITSTSRNNFGALAATAAPTRPALPATLEQIDLRLEILERTWMEVTVDGDVMFTGIARDGDVFEWQADDEVTVLTGNAIGVFVNINDIPWGRMGERGENKEESWQTTK